MILTWK